MANPSVNRTPHMCSRLIVASCILVATVGYTARDSTSSAIAKQFAESKGLELRGLVLQNDTLAESVT